MRRRVAQCWGHWGIMSNLHSPLHRRIAALAALLATVTCGLANNLNISGVSLIDAGGGQADIQFTMSWDNSWHESWTETGGTINVTNWDAVWVFAKYRQNGGLWKHVKLTAAGHTPTGGTVIDIPDDGGGTHLGALVHRDANGGLAVEAALVAPFHNRARDTVLNPFRTRRGDGVVVASTAVVSWQLVRVCIGMCGSDGQAPGA